jgi:ATP-dependent RNA helicase DDX21
VETPEQAVALALAHATGYHETKNRSLMTASDDHTTLQFVSTAPVDKPGFVFGFLRRHMDEAVVNEVKRMTLTADGKGAVFDVPTQHAKVGVGGRLVVARGRSPNNVNRMQPVTPL